MKIVSIFAEHLYALHLEDEAENEFAQLLGIEGKWMEVNYFFEFVEEHKKDIPHYEKIDDLPQKLIESANDINLILNQSEEEKGILNRFFKPLHNQEYHEGELASKKGRKTYLRLYALKIEADCFVITGGAIKFTHLIKDKAHTQKELQKLEKCRNFLKENGVFDSDSFYEFLLEDNDL